MIKFKYCAVAFPQPYMQSNVDSDDLSLECEDPQVLYSCDTLEEMGKWIESNQEKGGWRDFMPLVMFKPVKVND